MDEWFKQARGKYIPVSGESTDVDLEEAEYK
jgi:hypothetical protein